MKSPRPDTVSERIRKRLKDELQVRDISQRELADALTQRTGEPWTQSRVQKVLNGYVELKVDDAAAIAGAVGLFMSEVVRDRGLEFYAEMSPTELRMLEGIRQRTNMRLAVLHMLGMIPPEQTATTSLASVQKPRTRGRPRNSDSQGKR